MSKVSKAHRQFAPGTGLHRVAAFALTGLGLTGTILAQEDYPYDPAAVAAERARFIERMVDEHGFDRDELVAILGGVVIQQSALNAISRPAERVVPWYEYREIFLNEARIAAGAAFWIEHEERVARVSEQYGVDPEMILAIVGIESLYGERMGTYRVVDALGTLAFAYPPRASFFAGELESFLQIYAEEGADVLEVKGSYAGAMGAGQFIPSSYRAYAVDGDGDGRRNLWNNWDDILGSVANYFAEHGWREGGVVAVPAVQGTAPGMEPGNRLELDETVASLRRQGYRFDSNLAGELPAMLVAAEADAASTGYWVGLHNFRVITRYNRSVKYALAALELSQAIEQRYLALTGETP